MEKSLTILVTGGAGYIGSHFVNLLRKRIPKDSQIIIVDNFREGRNNIILDPQIRYEEVDIKDKAALQKVFAKYPITIVAHFAALASVPHSVAEPELYYETNVIGGWNLLECMRERSVKKIIFSSSASTYGEPMHEIIRENHPQQPTNPYGYTKLVFEHMLKDYNRAHHVDSISFRYFCASGTDPEEKLGEYHTPESHVIPNILLSALGKRQEFFVFGNDFGTPDGTGIRDYIHVNDLGAAHILALELLLKENGVCKQYNLGINKGFSVLELIQAAEKITGKKIPYSIKPRRDGDPSRLIADASLAQTELGWKPSYTDIEPIMETAYRFFKRQA